MKRLLYLLLIFCFASITLVSSKCIMGDCINGQGIYSFSNGDKYVGEFREGKLHGNGTLYFSSGDEYVGKFNNGKLNGKGIYSYNTGAIYLGYFRENKIHGQGSISYSSGDYYEGSFSMNSKNGYGTYTYANGETYEGNFRMGSIDGYGTYKYENGDIFEGEFKNGVSSISLTSLDFDRDIKDVIPSGCACSFKVSDQYFYDTGGIAVIGINNVLQILDDYKAGKHSNDKYTAYIQNEINIDEGYEGYWCDAELVILDKNGNKIIKKVHGGCGC